MPPPSPPLGLPPPGHRHHHGGGNKTGSYHLHVSSSLQDLSTYDVESVERFRLSPPKPAIAGKASFSKERARGRRRWRKILVSVVWILLLLSFVAACFFYFGKSPSSHLSPEYFVVLDCGSTGTRVFVYEATIRDGKGGSNRGGLPIELRSLPVEMKAQSGRAYKRMETEPGIAKLAHNESGLRSAMLPLIEFAEQQIPRNAHRRTSIFLCATAGMRKLPKGDSEWILEKAWGILEGSRFLSRKQWVRIISGKEEGYYGWMALNYHMGDLGSAEGSGTIGALDLGGSSLQVTFENEKAMQDENSLKLSIGDVEHHLSAYSLVGFGLNDAFDKSVVRLLRQLPNGTVRDLSSGNLIVKHPCLQAGYREKYVCSQCAAAISQEAGPVTEEGTVVKSRAGVPVVLLGAPKWEECRSLAKATVNLSEWSGSSKVIDCDVQPCALGDDVPWPHGHFYAMSGFFVVYRFFNLSPEATLDHMLQKGRDFCDQTWEAAKNSVVPQPFIEQYCFRAPYVASLLRHGLHITNDEVIIGSGNITWTLGVALSEAGRTLSGRAHVPLYGMLLPRTSSWSLFALILLSLVVLFCAISLVTGRFQKFSRKFCLPLKHDDATSGSLSSISFLSYFQHCRRASSGDSKMKTPLSPVAGVEHHSRGLGHGVGAGNIQLMGSLSHHNNALGLPHSHSSGSLVHENCTSAYWAQRGSTQLSSRKSPSREDLSSLLTLHTTK